MPSPPPHPAPGTPPPSLSSSSRSRFPDACESRPRVTARGQHVEHVQRVGAEVPAREDEQPTIVGVDLEQPHFAAETAEFGDPDDLDVGSPQLSRSYPSADLQTVGGDCQLGPRTPRSAAKQDKSYPGNAEQKPSRRIC